MFLYRGGGKYPVNSMNQLQKSSMLSKRRSLLLVLLSFLLLSCGPPKKLNEKWYQERWCALQNGESEVRLEDKTRCDCLTNEYAIEVDFSRKWAEAVGQSLHYAKMTGKQAGILLIVESNKDSRHYERLEGLIEYHQLPIKVWQTNQAGLEGANE